MNEMLTLFEAARRRGVPLVFIRTADQMAVVERIAATIADFPLVQWDAVRGMTKVVRADGSVNRPGDDVLKRTVDAEDTVNFIAALDAAHKLPQGAVLFLHNAHRQLTSQEPGATAAPVQALANLRDVFKRNFRMVVGLGPHFVAPPELEHDVIVIDDPLPGPQELETIVNELHQAAKLKPPTPEVLRRAVDAVSGLSSFEAEQVAAMSLTPKGLDMSALWDRKRVAIEQVPGLSVWRGTERFDDLVGMAAIKAHLRRRIAGKKPLGVVVWIDEIDKALANVEQDTSGVRMYQLLKLLTEMENNRWPGFVGVGVPGAGKSLIAKALGNEAGVPTVALDLGATESKYVGESEANLLRVMAIIKAVGRGHAYFVATSNAATVMRPELQRRFYDGMWMFDLMTVEERLAAFRLYMRKYELPEQPLPDHEAWTGAEIRNCCEYADEVGCTLVEASSIIVPMARSRANEVEELRRFAHGRMLDVNAPGHYQYEPAEMARQIRAIALPKAFVEMQES